MVKGKVKEKQFFLMGVKLMVNLKIIYQMVMLYMYGKMVLSMRVILFKVKEKVKGSTSILME